MVLILILTEQHHQTPEFENPKRLGFWAPDSGPYQTASSNPACHRVWIMWEFPSIYAAHGNKSSWISFFMGWFNKTF